MMGKQTTAPRLAACFCNQDPLPPARSALCVCPPPPSPAPSSWHTCMNKPLFSVLQTSGFGGQVWIRWALAHVFIQSKGLGFGFPGQGSVQSLGQGPQKVSACGDMGPSPCDAPHSQYLSLVTSPWRPAPHLPAGLLASLSHPHLQMPHSLCSF